MEADRQSGSQPAEASGSTESPEGSLAYLDQALWKQLSAAPTPTAFAKAWLTLQCGMISGVRRAVILLAEQPGKRPMPVGRWPDHDVGDVSGLVGLADTAVTRGRGVARETPTAALVAYPFSSDEATQGVAALEIDKRSQSDLRVVMRQLQWGSAWIHNVLQHGPPGSSGGPSQRRLVTVLEQVATSLEHDSFKAAAGAVATEAATALECERVSIGFSDSHRIIPLAISHSADFGKRSNLVRSIGAAMDESVDQTRH